MDRCCVVGGCVLRGPLFCCQGLVVVLSGVCICVTTGKLVCCEGTVVVLLGVSSGVRGPLLCCQAIVVVLSGISCVARG